MVRFCRYCKRALDDIDKFCRECGKDTIDSIDYQTFYAIIEKQPEVIIEKPIEKQPEVIIEKPIEVIIEKPEVIIEKPIEKQSEIIIEKPIEVIFEIEKPIEKQSEIIIEKPIEVIIEKPIEKQSEIIIEKPIEKHDDIDMLNQLLSKDGDKKGKDQRYLINKTGINKDNINNGTNKNNNDIVLLSKDSIEKKRVIKRAKYKEYENAIEKFIPELLDYIKNDKTGFIRIKVSDITEKMGGAFQEKSLSSIFFGLKYVLYHNGIWIRVGTLNDDSKIFIMRRKNGNDKLPQSLIKRN